MNEPAIPSRDGGLVRVRLDVAYDGTDFSGWAPQPDRRTVAGGRVYLTANSQDEAQTQIDSMCQRLLANPVIEDYSFSLQKQEP